MECKLLKKKMIVTSVLGWLIEHGVSCSKYKFKQCKLESWQQPNKQYPFGDVYVSDWDLAWQLSRCFDVCECKGEFVRFVNRRDSVNDNDSHLFSNMSADQERHIVCKFNRCLDRVVKEFGLMAYNNDANAFKDVLGLVMKMQEFMLIPDCDDICDKAWKLENTVGAVRPLLVYKYVRDKFNKLKY